MILGLGGLDHNGAACIVEDGCVVLMLEAERVTRIKNQGIVSPDVLTALLERLAIAKPRHIAVADRTAYAAAPWLSRRLQDVPHSVHGHHACHLAAAFAASPLERATVISIDGKGDGLSASVGRATRTSPPTIELAVPSAHSLGRLWWAASEFAGLPGHHAAGKTMALAAYGEPRYLRKLRRHVRSGEQGFRMDPGDEHADLFRRVPSLVAWMSRMTGASAAGECSPKQAHRDMAASVQQLTEEVVEDVVRFAVARTGLRDVCLAGGVALNGLMNQRLLDRGIVDTLFVPPFTDDRGLAVGAAALAAYACGVPVQAVPDGVSPYLGPAPAGAVVVPSAFMRGLDDPELAACAASLLAGAVVGWFEGPDEAGPRALGHRSILASPVIAGMRDRLNLEIKRREGFRPFGCSVLRSHVAEWFELDDDSPYMLRIVRARAARRDQISSALHVDGTSRLHTVTSTQTPRLARLLEALVAQGHPPLLINTSLNRPGEPIVHTVEQAFATAAALGLDALVVEGVRYDVPRTAG